MERVWSARRTVAASLEQELAREPRAQQSMMALALMSGDSAPLSSDPPGELLYMMHELSRLIVLFYDREMNRLGLTHSQWWALMHISRHEGATQTELAEIFEMGRASAGRLIERLERKGWIERRGDEGDSRLRRVFLRDQSQEAIKHMNSRAPALYETFLEGISPSDLATLIEGMTRIRLNAEHWHQSAMPQTPRTAKRRRSA